MDVPPVWPPSLCDFRFRFGATPPPLCPEVGTPCRICLDDDSCEDLRRPCACEDWVHRACLRRFIAATDNEEFCTRCSVCRELFLNEPKASKKYRHYRMSLELLARLCAPGSAYERLVRLTETERECMPYFAIDMGTAAYEFLRRPADARPGFKVFPLRMSRYEGEDKDKHWVSRRDVRM